MINKPLIFFVFKNVTDIRQVRKSVIYTNML